MAVYTEVSDDQLRQFMQSYDLGEVTSFKGIAEGIENSNYLVETTKDRYILTLYEKRVDAEDLPYFLDLLRHLADRGLSCPTPLIDLEGRYLKQLAGRPAALVTFLEGISVSRPTPDHCSKLGTALAEMHLAGSDFEQTRKNALSLEGWQNLFKHISSQADEVAEGLTAVIERELDFLGENWPKNLPTGIIHADLFPDNVFFLGDRLTGLIDFYFACNDALAYDIAICLNAWCFEAHNEFNTTKARQLLAGYNRLRSLNADECNAMPVLCRGAALRFLLTRTHDWVHTPDNALVRPKNPDEYIAKLRFHQSVASAREYGLDIPS